MKDRIIDALSQRGMYTLDLYRYLKYEGSLQAFELILNAGLQRGDWECADGYWKLKTVFVPEALPDPSDVEVDFLLNTARQFTQPAQKVRLKLNKEEYFHARNYQPERKTLSEMFYLNCEGYQIVPGKFERNAEGRIKRKACWQSQQVFMVEVDNDVSETSLTEVLEGHQFIRENAVMLVESIRSGYNDPNDDTCNGELRYRAFFMMPRPIKHLKLAEFLTQRICEQVGRADPSGSVITNGAFGLKGQNILHVGNYVQPEYIEAWNELLNAEQSTRSRYTPTEHIAISDIPSKYSERLPDLNFDSEGWSAERLPCMFNSHSQDGWGSRNNAMGVFRHKDALGYTFHCFKCTEKKTFRVTPRKRAKSRVKQVSDSESVYESLETAEVNNRKFWDFILAPRDFDYNRRVMHIPTDTGVGKDYAMIMESRRNDVLSLNPHNRLSAQLCERAIEEDIEAFHIKPRHHGFDIIEDMDIPERIKAFKSNPNVMCIHADRCQALLDKTGTCKDVLCNADQCEVYDFCSENRYVGQVDKAAQAQLILYSWMQLPTDPGAAGIYAQILSKRKRYERRALLSVVGEVDASKLLNRHSISIGEIQKGISLWQDEPAGQFYRMLSGMCNSTWTPKQRWEFLIAEYPKLDGDATINQLAKFPMTQSNKVEGITLIQALSEKLVSIQSLSDIETIPKMYPRHWTPVQWLEQFVMHCQNPEPPLLFTGDTLEFVTPPVLHPMCDTYVMQSATANTHQLKTLLTMANEDITYYPATADRVEHHKDAKIFKIATGRYVRSTCFHYDKEWKVTGLKDKILPHLQNLLGILRNTPGPKFVNTYKAIYDGHELEGEPIINELLSVPDVVWSNWAAGYGLDLEPDTLVIEFGTNEPSEELLRQSCQEIYMSDSEPLSYECLDYHEADGIRIDGVRSYVDKRVQAQYEQMTSLAQYQMANRTRPVRNASLVLIYSSHPCEWLDPRVQWITPDILGGNLRELVIAEPETKFQREKHEKQALAIELAREGMTNREIATQLGYKSPASVHNLLKGLEL